MKKYESPNIELIKFLGWDVITTSGIVNGGGESEDEELGEGEDGGGWH